MLISMSAEVYMDTNILKNAYRQTNEGINFLVTRTKKYFQKKIRYGRDRSRNSTRLKSIGCPSLCNAM